MGLWIGAIVLLVVLVLVVALNVTMRRRGYSIPGRTVVRCSRGHLFRTTWIEGGSFTAVRLGPTTRYQRCPTCRRFRIVHPVKDAELSDEERSQVAE